MKAIEKYVFGSFLSSFLLGFLVLSFVLTIGLLVQIVGYIIDGMPMGLVGKFAAVSFPETLQWTVPLALLVSSVLVFSRLSADSEIAAMRACGINLLTVMKYPALFALLCSILCAWINNEIVPRGHAVRRSLTSRLSVGNALDLIEPGVWVNDFPGFSLYAARKEGPMLYDVEVVDRTSSTNYVTTYRADRVQVSGEGSDVTFELWNARRTPIDEHNPGTASAASYTQRVKLKDVKYNRKIKDFRFFELLGAIDKDAEQVAEAREVAANAAPEDKDRARSKWKDRRRDLSKTKVELSKRFVFALASLCFVIVGIPLGIRAQRKESTIGMAISLAIALGYYLVVMLMLNLQKSYAMHPEFFIFLPALVCFGLSAWFLKKNL